MADVKKVEAEALLKVRLENVYDILDRALTTVDRNPQLVDGLLKTVDTAADDLGQTAQQALGPGGAAAETGKELGKAVDDPAEGVGDAAGQVDASAGPVRASRRPREGETKRGFRRGTRRLRSSDNDGR